MKTLHVVATIQALAGKEKEAEAMLRSIVAPTQKEKGCIRYDLHKRMDKPGFFYFIEEWENQQALNEHLGSKHIAEAMSRKAELLASLEIALIEPVPAT